MQRLTTGVLAHVDAGKTTLCEMLLYHGGALRQAGRVDRGEAALDFDPIERTRGITVFAAQADLMWQNCQIQLVDTPGHPDFIAEMERTLAVLDVAVLVVSAVEGVQAHTETIWRRLAELQVPVVVFLNKTDRDGADMPQVLEQLRRLSPDCALLTEESAAERDEAFLEQYLAGDTTSYQQAVHRLVHRRGFFPVLTGSALNDTGVTALLDLLAHLADDRYDTAAPFGAQVYQIRRAKNGARWAFCKVTGGVLRPRMAVGTEKVGEIRLFQGGKSEHLPQAEAGQLCAVTGLRDVRAGDPLGAADALPRTAACPLLSAQVRCSDLKEARTALAVLEDEEPALGVVWEEAIGQLSVRVMGAIQLEVLQALAQERFGLALTFGTPQVLYQETIIAPVVGIGHFEPLRHYAEVQLRLEPLPRGAGLTFASACSTDVLALHWQRLIETHVFERTHRGILTGAPLTDVRVTLLAGRAHEKHTEGGDFREATYRAIRQALMQAENELLEPLYALDAWLEPALVGRLLSDIQQKSGEADAPIEVAGQLRVHARVPVAEMSDYAAAFAAYTHGRGSLSLRPGGWEPCHNAADAIAARGYVPTADLAHTPDSVFCAHGAGYPVPWDQVAAMAHIGR